MVLRVRDISNLEGQRLSKVIRRSRDPVEVRRAQVILASAQGFASPKISLIVGMTQDYCRTLIHEFNESGLEMLKPRWRPGVKAKFTEEQKQRLVELATTRPRDIDLPFQQWSLSRLQAEAMRQRIVEYISVEWLRVILDEADVSHQSIKTWKQSTDPLFQEKKRRIDRLTSKKHNPPVVLSIDEIGPISLKPHGGDGWFREAKPDRVRATYNRKGGTRYEYLCLNVFHQQLSVQQEEHKGGAIWLAFLQAERAKYPSDERIYVIQDGLTSSTKHSNAPSRTATKNENYEARHSRTRGENTDDPSGRGTRLASAATESTEPTDGDKVRGVRGLRVLRGLPKPGAEEERALASV
ncbi:MAG: IS630 family transposase [Halobacteriales archaeon]|nr:IS630 family transposase [Halobacteriales archaeon]